MGVEENEDVKGYSWDGEPFQIILTDSYFLTYFLQCGLKFTHDCIFKEHDYLQGIPK